MCVDSIAKKKNAVKVNPIKEEDEKEEAFDSSLLTTDPSDVNNAYFKNLQPNNVHQSLPNNDLDNQLDQFVKNEKLY